MSEENRTTMKRETVKATMSQALTTEQALSH